MLGHLTLQQCDQLLSTEVTGRIGCHAGGRTYVVPVTYVYDGEHIVGHSGDGMKIRMMRENPEVCFEVDRMENLANWQSVICQGRFEELHGEDAAAAMRLLITRLRPLMTSVTSMPSHGLDASRIHRAETAGHHAVLYRIKVHEKTGRFERR